MRPWKAVTCGHDDGDHGEDDDDKDGVSGHGMCTVRP